MKLAQLGSALLFAATAMTAQAGVYTATDATYKLLDGREDFVTLLPTFAGGPVTGVGIWIDFGKCDDPGMPAGTGTACPPPNMEEFASEILFYLVAPDSTRVDLVYTYAGLAPFGTDQGSTKPNGTYENALNSGGRIRVLFTDGGMDGPVGPQMLNGNFSPEEPLSAFIGAMPAGGWELHMGDSVILDPLSYFQSCLIVTTDDNNNVGNGCPGFAPVPEPGSLPIVLLGGLLGGLALRRPAPRVTRAGDPDA